MTSQLIIKSVLLVCVAGIGWMMLRSPGGARHQASRRLVTLAFALFAIVTIAVPSLTAHLARFVGVGRGADLLLYSLVIAFLAQVLSSFRRDARRERKAVLSSSLRESMSRASMAASRESESARAVLSFQWE